MEIKKNDKVTVRSSVRAGFSLATTTSTSVTTLPTLGLSSPLPQLPPSLYMCW